MQWQFLAAWFFGGAVLANAIPHFVSGLMGRPFQSPFAKPPGQGFSSATVNVLWGFANIVIAYGLLCRVGNFDIRNIVDAVAFGTGAFVIAVFCARHFGQFNGGNKPERS